MPDPNRHRRVLHFDDINRSHEATGFRGRTDLPDFHVFTVEATYPSTCKVMPPYTMRFFSSTLLENSDDATLEVNTERLNGLSDTITFQSSAHVRAWVRGAAQRGFVVYFQPEFLIHHPVSLLDKFPFFRLGNVNVLTPSPAEKATLRKHLAHLLRVFTSTHAYRVQMLQALLLAFLFECKAVYDRYGSSLESQPASSALVARFRQLLEQHYLTKKSVRDYAGLLHVTPNHLSQTVSGTLGRTPHDLIADRVLFEAKKLLRYTDLPVAEVADYLGFGEPTHFGRFFKRHAALTPLQFRRDGGRDTQHIDHRN